MAKFALFALLLLSAVGVMNKLIFLAPHRLGGAMMLSNIAFEAVEKRWRFNRTAIEVGLGAFITLLWSVGVSPWIGLIYASAFFGLWSYAMQQQINLMENNPGRQEPRFGSDEVPLPNPNYILILKGPVLEREKCYDLGDWPIGHHADFEAIVLNPTILYPQYPIEIDIQLQNKYLSIKADFPRAQIPPKSGEFISTRFTIVAVEATEKPLEMFLIVKSSGFEIKEKIVVRSIFNISDHPVQQLRINRWKGGAKAGFAWRGDMDLYDPGTFQSVEGLRAVLNLSRRYRIPSSMYLSGRLSLVKEEHRQFCEKLGVDRDSEEIDGFIDFMNNEVVLKATIDFPFSASKPYAMELGNHMYLHYGTHSAMDPANNWTMMATTGVGNYFWQTDDVGSFAEQRDNATYNAKVIKEKLDYDVRSWAAPSRANDEYTSLAVEAAGMTVGSNTDATTVDDVFKLRPPHHPDGCKQLVEINKKYPGDPDNIFKVSMLKYWMGLAIRKGRAFVLMVHHHAVRFKGNSCMAMTEEILRYAVKEGRGNYFISTVHGLGEYWDRVLCAEHRNIVFKPIENRYGITITNEGNEFLSEIPIGIDFSNDKKMLLLCDLPARETTGVSFSSDVKKNATSPQDFAN